MTALYDYDGTKLSYKESAKILSLASEAGVGTLAKNLKFDRSLAHTIHEDWTPQQQRNYNLEKNYIKYIGWAFMVVYFSITPFFQTPYWCLKCYKGRTTSLFVYDCA